MKTTTTSHPRPPVSTGSSMMFCFCFLGPSSVYSPYSNQSNVTSCHFFLISSNSFPLHLLHNAKCLPQPQILLVCVCDPIVFHLLLAHCPHPHCPPCCTLCLPNTLYSTSGPLHLLLLLPKIFSPRDSHGLPFLTSCRLLFKNYLDFCCTSTGQAV
jgi:hypothetical protein